MDKSLFNLTAEPVSTSSPHKKKKANFAEQTLSDLLTISDVDIQEPNWCSTMLSCLLNDSISHDVTFKTSDGGRVSAHRVIVAAGSPVFHEMLQDQSNKTPQVDTDTVAFSSVVTYIYTGKVSVNSSNLEKILAAASCFKITSLETNLASCIANSLGAKTVVPITVIANDRKCEQLLEHCVEFMCNSANDAIRDANFVKLPDNIILTFCKSSELSASEINLFLAVSEWYKYNKKLPKATIKNIFREIRYPLISNIDLVTKVGPTGLADSNLYTAALEYHVAAGQYKGPPGQLVKRKSHTASKTTTATMSSASTEPSAAHELASSDTSHITDDSGCEHDKGLEKASKNAVVKKKPAPSLTNPDIKKGAGSSSITAESLSVKMNSGIGANLATIASGVKKIKTEPTDIATSPSVKKIKTEPTDIATPPSVKKIKTEPTDIATPPSVKKIKTEPTDIATPPSVKKIKTELHIVTPPVAKKVKTESTGINIQPSVTKKVKIEPTGIATQPSDVKKETSSIKKIDTSGTDGITDDIIETPSVITNTSVVHHSVITTAAESADDGAGRPLLSPNAIPKVAGKKRRRRCRICEGCLASNCGTCINCLHPDWRKPCVKRVCSNLQLDN